MPNPLKLTKCNQDILVHGWYFQTPTEIMMSVAKNQWLAHVIDQSLNESIVMDYYLLPPTCQSSSTGRPIFLSQLQWQPVTGQLKAKYKLHH